MLARIFLALSAVVWLPYGLYCLSDPGSLAASAGVVAATPTGATELRAMYGGLQAAIGVLALSGFLRGSVTRAALVAIGTLTFGLGSARLIGLFVDGGYTGYTGAGLGFEWTSALVAGWLLRRAK